MSDDRHDFDQSISEEDDEVLSKSSKNYSFSFYSQGNKERSVKFLSQLEILRKDANELGVTGATNSSEKGQVGLYDEDEIELPVFNNEGDSTHCLSATTVLDSDEDINHCEELPSVFRSDEAIMSEEEKLAPDTLRSTKVDRRGNTWSEVNREVEALVCLNENTKSHLPVGSFSKLNKSSKGGQKKVKPNLLFRFRSQEKAFPAAVAGANKISLPFNDHSETKELHVSANRDVQDSNTESMKVLNGIDAEKQEQNLLLFEGGYSDCSKHSLTELLECLQEKTGIPRGNSGKHYTLKGTKPKAVVNKNLSALGDRNMDGMLDVGSSSEDEDIFPSTKSVLLQRTIADQFHEALDSVSKREISDLIFHREPHCGLFERLQNVMGTEKERDMDFLKRFGTDESSTDGRCFLDVRILSSSLEAKLNVCCCALLGDVENSKRLTYFNMANQTGERILNIIFSPRSCSNVELEAGNLIRIHHPWKEVTIKGKDQMIILSTYFSQI